MKLEEIIKLLDKNKIPIPKNVFVTEDTTDFMKLDSGNIILLQDTPYLIRRNEREIGFGYDDEPKYWVKRAIDLITGHTKIIKMVFHEEFYQKIAGIKIKFFRSPEKEAAVLQAVSGNLDFMQGVTVHDIEGNNVRIIDYIPGRTLNSLVVGARFSHLEYIEKEMPKILFEVSNCLRSLSWLHNQHLVHGDVRWDHILFDRDVNMFRWIDFDYDYNFPENPFGSDIFGIGKILAYIIGKRPFLYSDIKYDPYLQRFTQNLELEDFSVLQQNLLMNLRKIYPYLPKRLNNILLYFSGHTNVYYDSVTQVIEDLGDALRDL